MKTFLFFPGFKEDLHSRNYTAVINAIGRKGYAVKFVSIAWLRTTIDDWVEQALEEYSKYDPAETILAGFSYGAMTAFVAAAKRNPAELWLFSLSGYFSEDINSKAMKKSWLSSIGHRRVTSFDKLSYNKLAPKISCRVLLFAGQQEMDIWPTMRHRTVESPKHLKDSQLTVIQGVGHDVSNNAYIESIKRLI